MYDLNIAENIIRLRHERKITQEQLADYLGVTKAAVSKWENRQSTPDIMLLPQLAAFFDISVDELLGYTPQLSKQQIEKIYQKLAKEFAECPFEDVMEETEGYVKQYYSCYPFLYQICVLWLNHFMLAKGPERQSDILQNISRLCSHIIRGSQNVEICNDAISLQAMVYLQLGRPKEVIDTLEETINPARMSQNSTILTQAYLMVGNQDKAEKLAQLCMYNNVIALVGVGTQYIAIHMQELPLCEKTIDRIGQVIEAYSVEKLHPNSGAGFEYQAAACYASHHCKEKTLEHLEKYVRCISELFSTEELVLHGDEYFTKIEEWLSGLDTGAGAPRNRKIVLEDVRKTLENPAFSFLKGESAFERLKKKLKEMK